MADQQQSIRPREQRLEATITRADGRVERLGTISYWHRNPLKRAAWGLWIGLKARLRHYRERNHQ